MESRGNRLGLIAVGLSLVALLVAFSGRWSAPQISIEVPQAPVAAAPAQPNAAPAVPVAPRADADPRQERQGRFEHGPRGAWGGPAKFSGGQHHHFGPFFFLGRLLRTLIGLSLIGLGLWWLRNRRGRGGWRGPGGRGGRGPGGRGGWRGPGPEYQGGPYQSDGPQVTHL